METSKLKIEEQTKLKYSGVGGIYKPETISHLPSKERNGFSEYLLRFKFGLVAAAAQGRAVLDVGCGNGVHAIELSKMAKACVGVDFSFPFVQYATKQAEEQGCRNVYFCCGNARELPFRSNSFDVSYSFAALYNMTQPERVVAEIARVLKVDGMAFLEFGNSRSLNQIVSKQYPELAAALNIPVANMRRAIDMAGLQVVSHYRFQLFPMWADRPWWLKPVLHPWWNKILSTMIGGKMIDEWLCRLPLIGWFAHRHIFVCKKPAQV